MLTQRDYLKNCSFIRSNYSYFCELKIEKANHENSRIVILGVLVM